MSKEKKEKEVDVCIRGSGAGAAVVAYALGSAGLCSGSRSWSSLQPFALPHE